MPNEPWDEAVEQSRKYPNPFFDPLSWSIPTIKLALQWSRKFYRVDPLVQGTIRKLATYPITNLVVEADNEKIKDKVTDILTRMHMRKLMMSTGIDYFCYGNSFVSVFTPIKRYVSCQKCGLKREIVVFEKVSWRKGIPYLKCTKCDMNTDHDVHDIPIKRSEQARVIRWNPEHIEIKFNAITGSYQYLYTFPSKVKSQLTTFEDPFYSYDTPVEFMKAADNDKRIILNQNKIFHMKRESLGDDLSYWGEPISFPILRDIYYFYVNKKAQEIMAQERIVPLRIIFPSSPGGISPDMTIRLGDWKRKIEEAVKKWRSDPNYLPIMPFPLGYQTIGGEGTRISMWPELSATQSRILLGLGVPPEFLVSGTWAGSSISVRMVENLLLNYRIEQEELVAFIMTQVLPRESIDPSKVLVRLSNFKMADDVLIKQIVDNLNARNKVSDTTMLTELGINPSKEFDLLKKDMSNRADLSLEAARIDARVAAEQMQGQGTGQLLAQFAASNANTQGMLEANEGMYVPEIIQSFIGQLGQMPPKAQKEMMYKLKRQMPNMYNEVVTAMKQMAETAKGTAAVTPGQSDNKPLPEQKPPRRDASPV